MLKGFFMTVESLAVLQVTLLQSGQTILNTFTANLQQRALDTFRKTGINVRLGVRVTEVTDSQVWPSRLQWLISP